MSALLDQAERDCIRDDLDSNLMVLAGAGAGKTHALVNRMIRLIATGRVDIFEVAAITFTRKAAGELRSRFYRQLRTSIRRDGSEEDARLIDAADHIDQCFIGTIHSFSARILRERPLEAGLPFDFKELDAREEVLQRREAWQAFINERVQEGDPRLELLEEVGFKANRIYDFFQKRIGFSELPLNVVEVDRPDLRPASDD